MIFLEIGQLFFCRSAALKCFDVFYIVRFSVGQAQRRALISSHIDYCNTASCWSQKDHLKFIKCLDGLEPSYLTSNPSGP